MNDKNQHTDELLDGIILGKSPDDVPPELAQNITREQWLEELSLHQSAAVLVQRSSVIEQVEDVHQEFFGARVQGASVKSIQRQRDLPVKKLIRVFGAVAAVFLVAFTIIVLYWYNNNSAEKLFAEHYHLYRLNAERGAVTVEKSAVISAYERNNFQDAVDAFKGLPSASSREKMTAGSAFLQLHQLDAAASVFTDLIRSNLASGQRLYQDEAEYYLALTYLRKKNYKEAYQLFERIYTDQEHTYNSEVSKWFLIRLRWLK
jgi:tetratricopeptide (TPR) repeat protein